MTLTLDTINKILSWAGLILTITFQGEHQDDGSFRFSGQSTKLTLMTVKEAVRKGLVKIG